MTIKNTKKNCIKKHVKKTCKKTKYNHKGGSPIFGYIEDNKNRIYFNKKIPLIIDLYKCKTQGKYREKGCNPYPIDDSNSYFIEFIPQYKKLINSNEIKLFININNIKIKGIGTAEKINNKVLGWRIIINNFNNNESNYIIDCNSNDVVDFKIQNKNQLFSSLDGKQTKKNKYIYDYLLINFNEILNGSETNINKKIYNFINRTEYEYFDYFEKLLDTIIPKTEKIEFNKKLILYYLMINKIQNIEFEDITKLAGETDKNILKIKLYYNFVNNNWSKIKTCSEKFIKFFNNFRNFMNEIRSNLPICDCKYKWEFSNYSKNLKIYADYEINSSLYMIKTLIDSVITIEDNSLNIKIAGNLDGNWNLDKTNVSIEFNKQQNIEEPFLIVGFGPSASGKTYNAYRVINEIVSKQPNKYPKTYLSIDGGLYRETSYIFNSIVNEVKNNGKNCGGYDDLLNPNFIQKLKSIFKTKTLSNIFNSSKTKSQIISFLKDHNSNPITRRRPISIYVPETCGINIGFKKSCIDKYLSVVGLNYDIINDSQNTNRLRYIPVFIWMTRMACEFMGYKRQYNEGKKYNSDSWNISFRNGLYYLDQARMKNIPGFIIHNKPNPFNTHYQTQKDLGKYNFYNINENDPKMFYNINEYKNSLTIIDNQNNDKLFNIDKMDLSLKDAVSILKNGEKRCINK